MKSKIVKAALALTILCVTLTGCGGAGTSKERPSVSGISSADDFSGKNIGCQTGTTGHSFVSDTDGAQVCAFGTAKEAMAALMSESIDAFVIDKEVAENLVSQYSKTRILEEPFAVEEYAISFSKENGVLGAKINQALYDIKDDGTLNSITAHWIGDNADQQSYTPSPDLDRSNGKIIMGTNAAFAPFEDVDADNNIVGLDVDMMLAISDRLNMELEIVNMEFDSIITAVQNGNVDVGVAAITVTPERQEVVDFTQSYIKTNQVIIVKTY